MLTLHHTSPVELNPDQFLGESLVIIKRVHAQRVVFDSVSTMALGVASERRVRELLYAIQSPACGRRDDADDLRERCRARRLAPGERAIVDH